MTKMIHSRNQRPLLSPPVDLHQLHLVRGGLGAGHSSDGTPSSGSGGSDGSGGSGGSGSSGSG